MKLAIILTNDWELFGDGKGDYYADQKEPLVTLLESINSFNAKLTVFAEVFQQLNTLSQESKDNRLQAISLDWEETVRWLVKEGHDVQLHIHPQIADNKLDYGKWAISDLPKSEMLNILVNGKGLLEETIKPADEKYKCVAFRAGGYAIQPSEIVLENLWASGIRCDSSVTKGFFDSFYNFNKAYSHYFPWPCKSDICVKQKSDNAILEIPIYSVAKLDSPVIRILFPSLYYRLFHSARLSDDNKRWLALRKGKKTNSSFKDLYAAAYKRSPLRLFLSKIVQFTMQFDYDKVPAEVLINYIKKRWNRINGLKIKNIEQFDDCYIPVVLIGHAKELHGTYNIEQFLHLLETELDGSYEFLTISEFYNNFTDNYLLYESLDYQLNRSRLIK